MWLRRPLLLIGAVCGSALLVMTCDSPTQPQKSDARISVDSLVSTDVAAGTTRMFTFVAVPGREYAVLLEAPRGAVQLTVIDSVSAQFVATLDADPTTGPLETTATPNFRSSPGTVYLLVFTGLPYVGVAFSFVAFAVDAAPEHHAVAIAIGDTVTGEDINPLVDVDTFVAPGQAGEDLVAVVQATGAAGSGVVALNVSDPVTGDLLGHDAVVAGDTSPPTTGRFRLPAPGNYRFEVRSVSSRVFPRYQGPYRFWSYAINRAPEHVSANLAIGSEIDGETVDRAGDIDEFSFPASAGAVFNAFLQSANAVQLEVAPDPGLPVAMVVSGPDTGLYAAATGRFTIAQGGSYLVRISGTTSTAMSDTGAYRFLLYPVNRQPETLPDTLVFGDSLLGEAIDVPGDLDEFHVTVGASSGANLVAQIGASATGGALDVSLIDSGGHEVAAARPLIAGGVAQSGTVSIGPGSYLLRVQGHADTGDEHSLFAGPYRVWLYKVPAGP